VNLNILKMRIFLSKCASLLSLSVVINVKDGNAFVLPKSSSASSSSEFTGNNIRGMNGDEANNIRIHDHQQYDIKEIRNSFHENFLKTSAVIALQFSIIFAGINGLNLEHANAADYGSLSEEQRAVAEAWRVVDNSFIDRTFNGLDWFDERQKIVKAKYKTPDEAQKAIENLVAKLGDKYTRYLSPSKYQSMVNSATGTLAGVGCELSTNKDGLVIASDVEANSPASKGGIKPKDIFVEVDGQKFGAGDTPDQVANKLRGPEGSRVGIVVERDGKQMDFILDRAKITVTSVKTYLSDKAGVGKVGVIRIKNFSGTTAATVSDAIVDLKKQGAKAFVLDLRNNPGGLLPGGVETAGLFLDVNKPVVFVLSNKGDVTTQETLGPGIDLDDPLVVFVNGNTASASEVMTAALKENGRAIIAGEKTFGKGIIQTIKPLSNDYGGVAVTVARYETPKRNDINKQGISVDIQTSTECDNDNALACLPGDAFQPPKQD